MPSKNSSGFVWPAGGDKYDVFATRRRQAWAAEGRLSLKSWLDPTAIISLDRVEFVESTTSKLVHTRSQDAGLGVD